VRPAELADEDFVAVPRGFGFRTVTDNLLEAGGVPTPRVSFEIGDLLTLEGLVGAGLGIAILPDQFAGVSGTVGIPLSAADSERVIGLTWRASHPLTPATERFLQFLRQAAPLD
jgi:DNA-binding transcriptional LysR family regulator